MPNSGAGEVDVSTHIFTDAKSVLTWIRLNDGWELAREDLRPHVAHRTFDDKRVHEIVDERLIARHVAKMRCGFQRQRGVAVTQYSFINNAPDDDMVKKGALSVAGGLGGPRGLPLSLLPRRRKMHLLIRPTVRSCVGAPIRHGGRSSAIASRGKKMTSLLVVAQPAA